MLITVKERTREFGIRKALGAKPFSILWLIIVESVTITTLFGYIGMVAGIGVTEWMNSAFGSQTMDAGMFQQTMFSDPYRRPQYCYPSYLDPYHSGYVGWVLPG